MPTKVQLPTKHLSIGLLIENDRNHKVYGYNICRNPELQNILKTLREETGIDDLNFEEPYLTIRFENTI